MQNTRTRHGRELCALPWSPFPLHLLLQGHNVSAALLADQALNGVGAAWPGEGPPATSGADHALGGVTSGDSAGESAQRGSDGPAPSSTSRYLHPLVAVPLASTSLHFLAKTLFGV